ncbi:hypothetical protein GOP47_0000015 [Adiantum capillus-veneris]|uniref:EF-hand domain-containing protein n=1 Tax=Adiantum capillus-veneris TaxID=13818 RepID=A0A9D4ZRZ9_ADICA|nr:hypothetical protein GOP47_0000015 [Adiantum capillus-veneris]
MLRSHASICALDTSSHAIASSIYGPLFQHNGRQASLYTPHQLKVLDLQFTRTPPRRNGFHAVCFKDEVISYNSDTSSVNDDSSLVAPSESSISCTTFNILAPIYKRVNGEGCRESEIRDSWLARNQKIIDLLLLSNSSIICLQEFWLGNEELTQLYDDNLSQADYLTYKLARTNGRGDGLVTAIRGNKLMVLDYKELLFNDCGDRVAQFFRLCTKFSGSRRSHGVGMEFLLVNTHLLFPHDFNYCLVRLRQVYKILKFIEQYRREHCLTTVPVILCGDWNGSKRGRVYKFLRSQGYLSSYDTAHDYTDADSQRWISHKNHRGNICEVDFIWLLNPDTHQKSLLASWNEAVLGTIKAKLHQIGLKGKHAFCFFQCEGNSNIVTLKEFQQGLQKLGLTETWSDACSEGLTRKEIDQVMQVIDINGNGVIDYNEFEALLAEEEVSLIPSRESISSLFCNASIGTMRELMLRLQSEKFLEGSDASLQDRCRKLSRSQSFTIKDAFLFPQAVEAGVWPDEYSLSDHAALTATFTLPGDANAKHMSSS